MEIRASHFEAVDRSLLIIRQNQPFIDWVNDVEKQINPDDPHILSMKEVEEYTNAYLIPEFEEDKKRDNWLKKNFKPIFEEELETWYSAPEFFPTIDMKTFKKFFTIEYIEMVFDLGE